MYKTGFSLYVSLFVTIALFSTYNPLHAMFGNLRRTGLASVPTRALQVAYPRPTGPHVSLKSPTYTTTSWFSRLGAWLGNWRQQRSYYSLRELFAIKTQEEHKQHVEELIKIGKQQLSPTQAHITHWLAERAFLPTSHKQWDWANDRPGTIMYPPILPRAKFTENIDPEHIDAIMQQEKKFFDAGYHVLYHSTQSLYYASHYIDTQLAILNKKLIENKSIPENVPLILRQGALVENNYKSFENTGIDLTEIREKSVGEVSPFDFFDRQYLLSCNPALTGNFLLPGECTLNYWDAGRNWNETTFANFKFALPNIISRYHILSFYTTSYEQKLIDIVNKFTKSLKTGVLLQIVFKDPNLLQECVYASENGGLKRDVCIGDQKTNNVIDIMEAFSSPKPKLAQKDINELQYRVILTSDKLLDVFNKAIYENFEIHAYANPQQVLDVFRQEIIDIMKQIERDFNDQDITSKIEKQWQENISEEQRFLDKNYSTLKKQKEFKEEQKRFDIFKELNHKRFGLPLSGSAPEE